MRKKSLFLFIVLAAAFSFSQEQENNVKLGVVSRLAFSMSDMFFAENIALNPAIGIVEKFPIINILSFNLELNFVKRDFAIAVFNGNLGGYYVSVKEYAVSIPMLAQIMPFGGPLFYLESGTQLDLPVATHIYDIDKENYAVEKHDYTRANHDWGFILGLGWNIGKYSAFGIRGVLGLTEVVKEKDVKSFLLGLSYSYFLY
jgi:hypothetical protein